MALIKNFNIEGVNHYGANTPKQLILVDSYLLRSIVDTFEHFAKWTLSDSLLFREN